MSRAAEKVYSPDFIRPFLRYEVATGALFWLPRVAGTPYGEWEVTEITAKIFNKKCAGKRAERWNRQNYGRVRLFKVDFQASRIAWALSCGVWPALQLDHIDGDPQNNRLENLREVTHRENCMNRKTRIDCPTSYTGIRPNRNRRGWDVRIGVKGREIFIGRYDEFDEAVKARLKAEQEHGFHPNHGRSA